MTVLIRCGHCRPTGCGKSTLMKAITGQDGVKLTSGTLKIHPSWSVGFLEQKGVSGSTLSVAEEVASRMDRLVLARAALEAAEEAMVSCDINDERCLTRATEELGEATEEFEAAGGYTVDEKISRVLRGLGFQESDFGRPCSDFSGGWQMRVALARLLLSEPELLILDEPTNHLDAAARNWLSGYLARYTGTVLLVSHDEGLLASAATSIAEVRNGRLDTYKSRSYAQWQLEREEREEQRAAEFEKQQEQIAHLQSFVDRFGASATKASQAQSRVKMIEKLKREAVEAPAGVDRFRPKLNLPRPPPCHFEQLELRGAAFGWGELPIVTGVNLAFRKGDRVVVRGPNGAGKSTLLRAMAGELPLKAGERVTGDGLELGFFKQDLAQELPMNERGMDVVQQAGWRVDTSLTVTQVSCRRMMLFFTLLVADSSEVATTTNRFVELVVWRVQSKKRVHIDTQYSEAVVLLRFGCFMANVLVSQVRTVMGALGLSGDKSVRPVGQLSGGEKARVALACFALVPHNLLLLDEPSNHLDVETIDSLTEALRSFEGAVIVISHDRKFCEALSPTHVITVDDGRATMEARDLTEADWAIDDMNSQASVDFDVEEVVTKQATPQKSTFASPPSRPSQSMDPKQRKAKEREVKKLESKMDTRFKKIDTLTAEVEKYTAAMEFSKVEEVQGRIYGVEAEIEAIMEEIETLQAKLE
jgi:ATPase subunit of ABC transporter with duplicated ATPase domains